MAQVRLRVLEFGEVYADTGSDVDIAEAGEIAFVVEEEDEELFRMHLTPDQVMSLAGAAWAAGMQGAALKRKSDNAVKRLGKGKG